MIAPLRPAAMRPRGAGAAAPRVDGVQTCTVAGCGIIIGAPLAAIRRSVLVPDLQAALIEQQILAHRPFTVSVPWADEIVYPYYDGLSIRNLAHTVVRLLDGKPSSTWLGSSPLDGRLWEHLWGQAKRIVLFISDGLGWRLLQEIVSADTDTAQIVADLTGDGTLTPLTSVVPSTTAPAARNRTTTSESFEGIRSAWIGVPHPQRHPATSNTSLTATGVPWSDLRSEKDTPSSAAASTRAAFSRKSQKALIL